MGDYGAYRRGNSQYVPKDLASHNDAVDYWLTYVTKQAIAKGRNNTVLDNRIIDAIVAGGN